MPESRDRLERPLDIDALFSRRRTGPLGILRDDVVGLPIRRLPIGRSFAGLAPRRGAGVRTPRSVMGRGQGAFRTPAMRTENTPPAGTVTRARGRFGNSVLPSWYPRTPLRDVTAVVRASERRRSTLRGVEGRRGIDEDLVLEGERLPVDLQTGSGVLLEPIIALATPSSVKRHNPVSALKMAKTLRKFSTVSAEDPEFLTPQKKLLDSIETVEKIVMEDLQRLQRTPSAKRAEREKKVRTLMSMR